MADTKGDDRKDVEFTAPWAENLRHRSNPNRVDAARTRGQMSLASGQLQESRTASAPTPATDDGPPTTDHSYYDVPMLKQPLWKWEIATYFFLGGVSAGSYVQSRLAEWHGGDHPEYRRVSRVGAYLALASFLPCPPLLIHDLGDPKRFHHMLRVWKPSTPMNFGTWSIVGYSGMAAAAVLREYMKHNVWRDARPPTKLLRMADKALLVAHDAAGIPFAILVAGYTGVLLSCTANPLWCKNPWLGPLFSASAIATGAEALSLALDLTSDDDEETAQAALHTIGTVAHAAELASLRGFVRCAVEGARSLRTGPHRKHYLISIGGIVASEVLKALPVNEQLRKPVRIAAAAMGLAAGFSLRWGMVMAGHTAAAEPHLSRAVSRASENTREQPARTAVTSHATSSPPALGAYAGSIRS